MTGNSENFFENVDRDYIIAMDEAVEVISSRKELAEFIFELAEGFRDGNFEPQSVHDYLHGAGALTECFDSWYRNVDIAEDPEQPLWRTFGRILYAAFGHS